MKLLNVLHELRSTNIGAEYGGLRATQKMSRGWEKSKLPPGVRDLWKVGDTMVTKREADKIVTKALLSARVKREKIDEISLEQKLDLAKELKLKL